MSDEPSTGRLTDAEILRRILEALEQAEPSSRSRILHSVQVFFGFGGSGRQDVPVTFVAPSDRNSAQSTAAAFSEDRTPSPKAFMMEKKPQTDVERVVCLAYYLAHYRQVENFKTLDISKLNTEAAQMKLSNPAYSVENATKAGYIIQSQKGHKKISAIGEIYVQALPDRDAAREAVQQARPRKRKNRE